MAVLALGGVLAALATAWMSSSPAAGIALAVLAFALVGLGVSACGTSLLVLLAKRVEADRRAAAATVVWVMMIVGFAVTAGLAGMAGSTRTRRARLVMVAAVCLPGLVLVACWRCGGWKQGPPRPAAPPKRKPSFRDALAQVWAEPDARRFTIFVFVSMLAYSAQDLILEPFAGIRVRLHAGRIHAAVGRAARRHAGRHAAGALAGRRWRAALRFAARLDGRRLPGLGRGHGRPGGGGAAGGPAWPLRANVFLLGVANGAFSIAAIGSMMAWPARAAPAAKARAWACGARRRPSASAWGLHGHGGQRCGALAAGLTGGRPTQRVCGCEGCCSWVGCRGWRRAHCASPAWPRPQAEPLPPLMPRKRHGGNTCDAAHANLRRGGGRRRPGRRHRGPRPGRQRPSVLLLDRAGRIKPCGGAIPPRLIKDFAIPEHLLVARARSRAHGVAGRPRSTSRSKAASSAWSTASTSTNGCASAPPWRRGARAAPFERLERDADGTAWCTFDRGDGRRRPIRPPGARRWSSAPTARAPRWRAGRCPAPRRPSYVFAYHEIVPRPQPPAGYDATRCDVVYRGTLSPDFYGWVFPHGKTLSIGTGSADKGFSLRGGRGPCARRAGLTGAATIRREGAPIPMKPLPRWDNGRDVVLAGDAAGVVAPASGEGIYYAMYGGRVAAEAVTTLPAHRRRPRLAQARKRSCASTAACSGCWASCSASGTAATSGASASSASAATDVQQLTFESYMNKELVRKKPMAHVRIFFKDLRPPAGPGAFGSAGGGPSAACRGRTPGPGCGGAAGRHLCA
jgi:hypothetical protein